MDSRSLQYIAEACGGELLAGEPDRGVNRVCTDSRHVRSGDLFIALAGDRFDAHEFLGAVDREGVGAVVVERNKVRGEGLQCARIEVENTRVALGRLAAAYRNDFTLPVIAVGGCNGKTTTKELLAAVLSTRFHALWNEASYNNDIGVPLTLLRLERNHEAAVLEVGTNHPGELAPLMRMIAASLSVVTSLGREHLEYFGDMQGVVAEDGWVVEGVAEGGTCFVNGDTPWTRALAERARGRMVNVGFGPENDWRITGVNWGNEGTEFQVSTPYDVFDGTYFTRLLGRHQAVNATLAMAVAAELGMIPSEVATGLKSCVPAPHRLEVCRIDGITLLDDTYNANADSVLAALEVLVSFPCNGRRIAVLGDMAELGAHAGEAHEEVGERVADSKLDSLVTIGRMRGMTAWAARAAGTTEIREFADVPEASHYLKAMLREGDVVLLKASRAARLERMIELLREATPVAGPG
jgi:UDP-N-acetylmuramoyl-tripeptide--D-alanyl-D-alanine ligase